MAAPATADVSCSLSPGARHHYLAAATAFTKERETLVDENLPGQSRKQCKAVTALDSGECPLPFRPRFERPSERGPISEVRGYRAA